MYIYIYIYIYIFRTDKHRKAFHTELESIEPLKDMVIGDKTIFFCERMWNFSGKAKLLWENATFCDWMQNFLWKQTFLRENIFFGSTKRLLENTDFFWANSNSLGNAKHLHANKFLAVNVSWGNKCSLCKRTHFCEGMQHFSANAKLRDRKVFLGMQNFSRRTNYSGRMQRFLGERKPFWESEF